MHWSFRFAYPWVLYVGIPSIMVLAYVLMRSKKKQTYHYPLTAFLGSVSGQSKFIRRFLSFLNMCIVGGMLLALARPQWIDVTSSVTIEGIDIMMVLDVSGSMQVFDDLQDRRSRFEVSQVEAINFIDRRPDDQIGLVLFAHDAVVRCPLTHDKLLLKSIVEDTQLGVINEDGTVLSRALVMAAQRLKKSKAKSKIIILLTDGEPTPGLDIHPKDAVTIAEKLGIKIYTIGVGGVDGGYWADPMFGVRRMGFKLNKQLLQAIAETTGGRFFEAQKPDDLKTIYATIDKLEKTEHDADIFTHYEDMFSIILWFVLACMLISIVSISLVWLSV